MPDQADLLRRLARDTSADEATSAAARLIVVCGGKGGVGTTTVSVHVAAALAALGKRCVLADADLGRADATSLCGFEPSAGLDQVLSGRCGAQELLLAHPAGMEVLPAAWAPHDLCETSPAAVRRLGAELIGLSRAGRWVVADAGNQRSDFLRYLWRQASHVLLVTTPDDVAVMDTYACAKLFCDASLTARMGTVVNRASGTAAAARVQERLEQACRRFLAVAVEPCGQVPETPQLAASEGGRLSMLPSRDAAATHAFARLARWVCHDGTSSGRTSPPATSRTASPTVGASTDSSALLEKSHTRRGGPTDTANASALLAVPAAAPATAHIHL